VFLIDVSGKMAEVVEAAYVKIKEADLEVGPPQREIWGTYGTLHHEEKMKKSVRKQGVKFSSFGNRGVIKVKLDINKIKDVLNIPHNIQEALLGFEGNYDAFLIMNLDDKVYFDHSLNEEDSEKVRKIMEKEMKFRKVSLRDYIYL